MILYFTGTGNAKYIAEKIAKVTGDETKNIVAYTRDNEKFLQGDGERLVLVSPVYYWGIPESVKGFLKTLKTAGRYFAIVLECGGSTGNAQGVCERYVRPDAVFGVVAVDNFCPMFKIESAEETENDLTRLTKKSPLSRTKSGTRKRATSMQKREVFINSTPRFYIRFTKNSAEEKQNFRRPTTA